MKHWVADITVEAQTPLRVGTGQNSIFMDMPVQRDWNGLPMILGTSIAGAIRAKFDNSQANNIFGHQIEGKDEGETSKVIFSNALLVGVDNKVIEEPQANIYDDNFYRHFETLPIRQHTAITDRGVASKGSKYDEELIYKGTKFKLRIEMIDEVDSNIFESILNHFATGFVIGGGATKGFGRIKALDDIDYKLLDLEQIPSSLNNPLPNSKKSGKVSVDDSKSNGLAHYTLTLKPDNFFMFGSGFGSEDGKIDAQSVYEYVISYEEEGLLKKKLLIPASSVKGAISHRLAYRFNLAAGYTIDNGKGLIGEDNPAVVALFGHKKESVKIENIEKELGQKGRVRIEDAFLESSQRKVFDHVAIDRFTGGAIDGALFNEETVTMDEMLVLRITVDDDAWAVIESDEGKRVDAKIIFEDVLKEICTGMLPLGGMTTKGHGVFCGKLERDSEMLIDNLGECNE